MEIYRPHGFDKNLTMYLCVRFTADILCCWIMGGVAIKLNKYMIFLPGKLYYNSMLSLHNKRVAVLVENGLFVTYMTILWIRLPHMGAMPKDHGEYILLFGEPIISLTWALFAACVAMPTIRRHVDPHSHEDVYSAHENNNNNDDTHTRLSYQTRATLARLVKEEVLRQQQQTTECKTLLIAGACDENESDERDSGVGMCGTAKMSTCDSEDLAEIGN
jgi:hypothetical protein